ncbi:VanZ family protein [Rothia sp. 88186D007BW]
MRYYFHFSIPVLHQALSLWALLMIFIVPTLCWCGRKLPTRRLLRRIAATSVLVLYATGVIAYTFLPLPDQDTFICPDGWGNTYPRFYLGWSLQFAIAANDGLLGALFSTYMLQMLLNVLLFLPFGFLARWRWGASFRTVMFSAFSASLTIELTQVTGIWGYYDCAIRTFDAEDIFNNTLGALIGWSALAAWQHRHTLPRHLRHLFGRQGTTGP